MEQKSRTVETRDEAVRRLAVVAQERGLRVYVHEVNGRSEWFVTSASQPDRLHRATVFSCDCAGFISHGRCTHNSALLAFIGQLPPTPEPPAPAAMVARRTERVVNWRANNLTHANTLLAAVIAKQDAGETVPAADIREATEAVALYAAAPHQPAVALAA